MARSLRRRAVQIGKFTQRRLSLAQWVVVLVAVALFPVSVLGQSPGEAVPRTSWGHPDLQGVWDYRTTTPLERPEHLGTTAVVTGDAADALTEWRYQDNQAFQDQLLGADWSDHLDSRLAEGGRTSLIVDPPNGRIPVTVAADEWRADRSDIRAAHGPEIRLQNERCATRPLGLPSPPAAHWVQRNGLDISSSAYGDLPAITNWYSPFRTCPGLPYHFACHRSSYRSIWETSMSKP